jgi:hypothetical protein
VLPLAADKHPMSPINSSAVSSLNFSSAENSGRAAIATSSAQLAQDAQQIVNPDNQNLTDPLLDSTQSLLLTQAAAAVISTSDQMLGTMLNVFA